VNFRGHRPGQLTGRGSAIQALYQVVHEKDGQIRKFMQQLQGIRETDGQLKTTSGIAARAKPQNHRRPEERLTSLEVQDRIARGAPIAAEARSKQSSSPSGTQEPADKTILTNCGGSEWESNPPSPPKDDDRRF
jgi:hypothetical protein